MCLSSGIVPKGWCEASISPIHRKGDCLNPASYRPISLLNTLFKLLSRVLNARLTNWVREKERISTFQAGFQPGKSCLDHIFSLIAMIQLKLAKNEKLYVAFICLARTWETRSIPRIPPIIQIRVQPRHCGSPIYPRAHMKNPNSKRCTSRTTGEPKFFQPFPRRTFKQTEKRLDYGNKTPLPHCLYTDVRWRQGSSGPLRGNLTTKNWSYSKIPKKPRARDKPQNHQGVGIPESREIEEGTEIHMERYRNSPGIRLPRCKVPLRPI